MQIVRENNTANPAGSPKFLETAPEKGHKRDSKGGKSRKNEPNPHHYEDFNRLLGGMARSSE